jgi:hypothetical protein
MQTMIPDQARLARNERIERAYVGDPMIRSVAYALAGALLVTSAHAIDVFEEGVSCSKQGIGCAGPANPEIVAAVQKRYPNAEDIWAFEERLKNGKYRYQVAFFTNDGWHKACQLTLKPIKLSNCRIVHA